mgnify:CR=1 FL=1
MKSLNTFKLSFIVLLCFISCDQNTHNLVDIGTKGNYDLSNSDTIFVNPKYKDNTDFEIIDNIEDIYAIKLSNEELIAEVSKIRFSQNHIYILDNIRQAIFVFDNNGNLLNTIDNSGRGPGEFAKLTDFTFDLQKNQLVLLDNINRKLLHFDSTGVYLGENRFIFHARNFDISADQVVLYNDFNERLKDTNYNVFISNRDGEVSKYFFPFSSELSATNRVKKTYFTRDKNTINYIGHYDRNWYKFNGDSVWLAYNIDFGDFNSPDEIIDNVFDAFAGYAHGISYFHETEDYLAFTYRYLDKLKTVYYNKNSKFLFHGLTTIPHMAYLSLVDPVIGTRDDYFVQTINPQMFIELFDKYGDRFGDSSKLREIHKKFYNILNSLNEDDNPIIIFFKLKP